MSISGDHGKVNANLVGVHLGDQWYLTYLFGNNIAAETGRPFTAKRDFYSPAAMYNSGWGYNFGVAAGTAFLTEKRAKKTIIGGKRSKM